MSGRTSALRSTLGALAACALTAAIVAWIWRRHGLDLEVVLRGSARTNLALVAMVFALSAAFGLLAGAHKLHLVLCSLGVSIRYRDTLLVRLGSAPARAMLPFASGELLQAFYFKAASGLTVARASGAIVFDKGANFIGSLFWLALAALVLLRSRTTPAAIARILPVLCLVIVASLIVSVLAVFATAAHRTAVRWASRIHPKLGVSLSDLLDPFRQLGFSRKLMLIGYGVLFQFRPLLVCYLLLSASGFHPGLRAVLASSSAAVFAGYAPGFVAGSGPREAVLLELLRPAGVPAEAGFLVGALMTLSVNVLPALVGAPWALWMLRSLRLGRVGNPRQEVA